MEPETRAFLKKVALTMLVAFVWLLITATAAVAGDNAFIYGTVRLANILFYAWFVASIFILVRIYKKLWGENQ